MKSVIKVFCLYAATLIFDGSVKAQIPRLNSYASAPATIYLDLDGQYITGTSWNGDGPINGQSPELPPEMIFQIFLRVAEDFRPFNLNITTDSLVYFQAPFDKRMRIVITPTSSWYKAAAGGISYVGSFNWGDETPAWVFTDVLGKSPKYIAEACSHEIGHTLGLQHQSTYDEDCNKSAEYHEGQGSREIGWAPIMGLSYYKNFTTWHIGPNTIDCATIQDDIEIIAGEVNSFGFRTDDHGDSPPEATPLEMQGNNFQADGLINGSRDIDVFKISLGFSTNISLGCFPQNVGIDNEGANLDIKILLLNSASDTIGAYDFPTSLGVVMDTLLNSGTYYVAVASTSNINHSGYGSMGQFTLVGSLATVLPLERFILKASDKRGEHLLSWSYTGNEDVKKITVELSADGKTFRPLAVMNSDAKTYMYTPHYHACYYRVSALTVKEEKTYFSNITFVTNEPRPGTAVIGSRIIRNSVKILSTGRYRYEVFDIGGQLLGQGTLANGMNEVNLQHARPGMLLIRMNNTVTAWTEKIIKH